jgi:DNA-binding response OmpR family regulator
LGDVSNFGQNCEQSRRYRCWMGSNSTVLCILREPTQLSLLQENGYELVTATTGHEGLRRFMAQPVDAIVVEYQLGLLDGAVVAEVIKQVRPEVPIVMLTDNLDLPDGALKSVDALVTKSDGPHFLLATVHFVLKVKSARLSEERSRPQMPGHLPRPGRSARLAHHMHNTASPDPKDAPFSAREWRDIRTGTVRF